MFHLSNSNLTLDLPDGKNDMHSNEQQACYAYILKTCRRTNLLIIGKIINFNYVIVML